FVVLQAEFVALRDAIGVRKLRGRLDLFSVFHDAGSLIQSSLLRTAFPAPNRTPTADCVRGIAIHLLAPESDSVATRSPHSTPAPALESPALSNTARFRSTHAECHWWNPPRWGAFSPASWEAAIPTPNQKTLL